MLMEVEEVFGGGERGLFWEALVVGRWWFCCCSSRVEREREEGRERKSLASLVENELK